MAVLLALAVGAFLLAQFFVVEAMGLTNRSATEQDPVVLRGVLAFVASAMLFAAALLLAWLRR